MNKTIRSKGEREAEDSLDRLYKKQGDETLEITVFVQGKLQGKVTSPPANLKGRKHGAV